MALLALPVFVPNVPKSATGSPGRARTVEQEIILVEQLKRERWNGIERFSRFGCGRWKGGAPNVANVAKCRTFLGGVTSATFGTFGTPCFCAKYAEKCHGWFDGKSAPFQQQTF